MSVVGKLLGVLALAALTFFLGVVLFNPDTSFRDWMYCLPKRMANATPAEIRVCETSTPALLARWNYGDFQQHEEARRALDVEKATRR